MDDRSTEDVYEHYKNEMYQIEEGLERIQYKKRGLEKEKEERRKCVVKNGIRRI